MLGMKPRMLLHSVVALIGVVILEARGVCCTGNNSKQEELDRRITALRQTVDFMAQRPHQMNVDAIFGLTMVEGVNASYLNVWKHERFHSFCLNRNNEIKIVTANVKQTLDHENARFFDQRLMNILAEVLSLSQRARLRAMAMVTTKTSDSAIFLEKTTQNQIPKSEPISFLVSVNRVLNQPEIWIHPINWTSGLLGPRPPPSKYNTQENVVTYFNQGSPNETESDRCIAELAGDFGKRVCQVSEYCEDILLKNDKPRGYPLTHRLLYVQIAIALGCKERKNTPFEKLITDYCTAILQDAVDMEDTKFPAIARDMITEQVLLCGMQGYTEFANEHYARLIISWPNSARCYSAFGFPEENSRRRSRRETEMMDFGCDNHATALGAASLSLLIRNFVETLGSQSVG